MTHWKCVLLAVAAACCLPIQAFAAQSNLVFVLDASGSVWGRVGGSIKIVAAKQVMADLLADMPPGVEISLVTYGHRRKGDCTDISLTEVVAMASKQTVEVPIDTGLRLTGPDGIAAPYEWSLRPADATISDHPDRRRLDPARGDVAVFGRTLDPQVVPAGAYRLLWWQTENSTPAVDLGLVQILPGKLNEFVVGTGLVLKGADWIPGGSFYRYELVEIEL